MNICSRKISKHTDRDDWIKLNIVDSQYDEDMKQYYRYTRCSGGLQR
jgi:hypothetical protein